jgi:hypothetical protein
MRRRAAAVLGLCGAIAGCGGGERRVVPPSSDVHRSDGLRFALPAGWHLAARSLTPALVNPREVLTAGTGRLAGTGANGCNHMPTGALKAMRATDVLVTVQERNGGVAAFPGRPAHFDILAAGASEADACAGPGAAFRSHWFEFRQAGRGFHVLVAVGRSAPMARVRQAAALLDSLRLDQATFDADLAAARFPAAGPWRTRVSGPSNESARCLRQRISWASTAPFADGARALPPHHMIEVLAPDGIVIAVIQSHDRCHRSRGLPALHPPLTLYGATRMGFEGPRGGELPLYRVLGRFPDRYGVDVWVFFGRPRPTAAQWAAAELELGRVRWPARL